MSHRNNTFRQNSQGVPGAGMRGGLGRTLLTAFLLLSIVPLGVISFVAANQARRNLQEELMEKLVTVATLTEHQIRGWVTNQQSLLTLLSNSLAVESAQPPPTTFYSVSPPASGRPIESSDHYSQSSLNTLAVGPLFQAAIDDDEHTAFLGILLVNERGQALASYPTYTPTSVPVELLTDQFWLLAADHPWVQTFTSLLKQPVPFVFKLSQPIAQTNYSLITLLNPTSLTQSLGPSCSWSQDCEAYLVLQSGLTFKLNPALADIDSKETATQSFLINEQDSAAITAALSGQSGAAVYENHQGEEVIGAYRWISELNMALLVEQTKSSALAASDDLAVALIGATLGVVLLTALIAAAVTRRITLPIIQLTATAVEIASGDLGQKVPASRRDEIGILARAFNVMTTKLRVLYEDLEAKVKERTQQLEEANAEIRYRAMQLAISAEVGRVVTSILDQDLLLSRVVELIRDCFQAYFVAIYFVEEGNDWAVLSEGSGALGQQFKAKKLRISLDDDHLVSRAVRTREPQTCVVGDDGRPAAEFPHTRAELTVPLQIGGRVTGVLDVHSTHKDAFDGDETMVLETLSGQIVVAIENARLYATERRVAAQLREGDELRRRFLTNMSRELRMPLNNIIGFSRVILKEIDGPITDLQRKDLNAIHDSGQQLLALFNDILDIAQIEAGAMELDVRPVDMAEIAHSVVPTANALLQGRPIAFHYEITGDLPPVLADPHRLRQVLVKLLSNATKFTRQGEIKLRVWRDDGQVLASVIDTGIGIPDKDRDKVFELFRQLSEPIQSEARGTGLGLALSKEIVQMHGGSIWFESKEGKGTAFTIALPAFRQHNNNRNRTEYHDQDDYDSH